MTKLVGVDGCRAGWFGLAFSFDKLGANKFEIARWEWEIFSDVVSLWGRHYDAELILVDIPIGLKEKGEEERKCDKEARKLLGKRGQSVFRVPCRAAVYEKTYQKANYTNKVMTGKGLSKQTWFIVSKIREMDRFIINNSKAANIIKEAHPELCFMKLANNELKYSKQTKDGLRERFDILRSSTSSILNQPPSFTQDIVNNSMKKKKRAEVAKNDILDALSLTLVLSAWLNSLKALKSIPDENEEYDEKGIKMEIKF
ncbi:DUF429 domain-containing protein [Natranaerofaba carboxydovora]|uniref:DUF429 domain-containing protein n=1 Tax=Natranaerofaba carboxydovora TaxID=2742683 RepID=UPI001F139113|nr:DUF429 domain-containing protein [Natranaerofaba carboxydovora]UMZ74312.1 hypothetical protein ACONDI_01900 [Natranaerofaba carboxydovora]